MADGAAPASVALAGTGRALSRLVLGHPVTVGYMLVLIALDVLWRPILHVHRSFGALAGAGFEPVVDQRHWWTVLTSLFFAQTTVGLVVTLAAAALLLGVSESLLGWWRTILAFVVTGVVGTLAGVGVQALGAHSGELWSHDVVELVALDPLTAIAGTLMTASGFAPALWRRRIRVLTVLVSLVFLLYAGTPSDLYRLLAVVAGLLLGIGLRPESRVRAWVRSSHHEVRVIMASVVAVTAVGPTIALFSPSRFGPLAPVALLLGNGVPDAGAVLGRCQVTDVTRACLRDLTLARIASPGAVLVSVIPLVVLLLAAYGLLRGRRFAVWLAVAINLFLAVVSAVAFGLLPSPDAARAAAGVPAHALPHTPTRYWELALSLVVSIVLPILIAVALLGLRRHFSILASRRRIAAYLVTLAGSGLVLASVYVIAGWLVRDTAFTRVVNVWDLVADVAERFVPVEFLRHAPVDFLPHTPLGLALYHGVGLVFWAVVVVGAIPTLADSPAREHGGDASHVRALLERGGGDSLAYMATWPGNSYWFDPGPRPAPAPGDGEDGGAAIAYRVVGRVALTTGGPFGTPGPKNATIARFARFCDDNAWVPVFYAVETELKPAFDAMGWGTIMVAEETVIRPQDWSTKGKKWQDVRSSINRAARAGLSAVWTSYAGLTLTQDAQLAEMSEQWVAEKGLPEMGFTLGGLDELQDASVRLMIAVDEHGRIEGVTSWLPSYRDGVVVGWTLDFMRRRPDGINGVMEFLIAESAEKMRNDGIQFMSLSAAPLAHTAGAPAEATSGLDRVLGYLSSSLEPVYGFRSLLNFKRKFQPEFHPLIMAYPDAVVLPAIGLALARAYLPTLSVRQAAQFVRGRG